MVDPLPDDFWDEPEQQNSVWERLPLKKAQGTSTWNLAQSFWALRELKTFGRDEESPSRQVFKDPYINP